METPDFVHCITALEHLRVALSVLNGKWKLQIMVSLYTGHHRFSDIKQSIPTISAKVLAKELKDLEAHQLIQRTVQAGPPVTVCYAVLPYAHTLDPIIFMLRDWGMQHQQRLTSGSEPAIVPCFAEEAATLQH